jgi:hypothetical protein
VVPCQALAIESPSTVELVSAFQTAVVHGMIRMGTFPYSLPHPVRTASHSLGSFPTSCHFRYIGSTSKERRSRKLWYGISRGVEMQSDSLPRVDRSES